MTVTKSMEEILLDDVCAHLGEMGYCSVFADWYADQGDTLREECWRWFATYQRKPEIEKFGDSYDAWWFSYENAKRFPHRIPHSLPRTWLSRIDDTDSPNKNIKMFDRHESTTKAANAAYLAAVTTYLTLTDEERKELWKDVLE